MTRIAPTRFVTALSATALALVTGATLTPATAQAAAPVYRPRAGVPSGVSFTPADLVRGNPFSPDGKLLAGSTTVGGVSRAAVYEVTTHHLRVVGRPFGGTSSSAVDVNDRGDVVATVTSAGGTGTAYLPRGSSRPVSLGTAVTAYAMNNSGVVVGETTFRAIRWTRATGVQLIPAGPSGLEPVRANGVNSAGLVVGETDLDGFVYDPASGATTELPQTAGQLYTTANDVNDRGSVVGQLQAGPDDTRAVVYAAPTGALTVLPSGGQAAYAATVSRRGTVAGPLLNTSQVAVWRDCGTTYRALGAPAPLGSPRERVFGTDSQGATWATYQGRVVRWVRTPVCSS